MSFLIRCGVVLNENINDKYSCLVKEFNQNTSFIVGKTSQILLYRNGSYQFPLAKRVIKWGGYEIISGYGRG